MSQPQVVQTFFVTLKRSFIGRPWFHKRILESLGFKRRMQCIEKPNNARIRGELFKVGSLSAPGACFGWGWGGGGLPRIGPLPCRGAGGGTGSGSASALRVQCAAAAWGAMRVHTWTVDGCRSCSHVPAASPHLPHSPHAECCVQVAHLVRIETDQMYLNRKLAEAEAVQLRPPIVVPHTQAAPAWRQQAPRQPGGPPRSAASAAPPGLKSPGSSSRSSSAAGQGQSRAGGSAASQGGGGGGL